MENLLDTFLKVIFSSHFYIPVISVIGAFLLIKLSKAVIKKVIIKDSRSIEIKRRNTIVALINNILKYLIIIITCLVILSAWGINVSAFIAGLGVVGVVAGLAIQDALKDIIMGCNIILDNFFVVGDLVRYENFTGTIIEFGLKNTKIRSVDGTVLILSNRDITKIYNLSQHSASIQIKVSVAYEEKEEKVVNSLNKVIKEVNTWEITTAPCEYLGIDELGDSSVTYLFLAHCKSLDQYEVKRKILSLVKETLEKDKIKIPYPQIEVHNGKNV